MGFLKGKAVVIQARDDIKSIKRHWPEVVILWSAMVPWLVWRRPGYHRGIERARQKANKEFKRSLEEGLRLFVPHPELHVDFPELYQTDRVHLSDKGLDIFLDDLWQWLLVALGF